MKNEMTLDKTGLTIPGSELAECGMAGVDLSAQMTHSLLLLMPREMTALQTADALAGLFDAASQLVSALLDACRMPCCKNCDSDVREFDLDAVPAPIRKLLLDTPWSSNSSKNTRATLVTVLTELSAQLLCVVTCALNLSRIALC